MRGEGRWFDALMLALIVGGLFLVAFFSISSVALSAQRSMEPESWAERQCRGTLHGLEDTPDHSRCLTAVLGRPAWWPALPELVGAAVCFSVAVTAGPWRGARSRRARAP